MAQVGLTALRLTFAAHLDGVERDRSDLVVTRQNHETLVILPLAELDPLRETLHLLGTSVNATRLLEAVAQIEAGGGSEHDPIEG